MCEEYWFGCVTRCFLTGLRVGGGVEERDRDGGPILEGFTTISVTSGE